MSLSYGLNITKKTPSSRKPAPAKRKPIFGEDDEDSDDAGRQGGVAKEVALDEIDLLNEDKPSRPTSNGDNPKLKPQVKSDKPSISIYGDLSSKLSSTQHADEAKTLDPSIYDYDAAYDSLHAASSSRKAAEAADVAARRPKYMTNLLAAAEVRKRDQLRAKDKMLAKEREAEGDEFADKEKFVTAAYKQQQEEVRQLEEEERKREEEEQRRKKGTGMTGFYRSVLERDEKRHEEAVAAAATATTDVPNTYADEQPREKTEAEIARELEAAGKAVAVNDEGLIVDKRQLLSAGLNTAPPRPTPKIQLSSTKSASNGGASLAAGGPQQYQGKAGAQRAMRERQTRMLEEQLQTATKRAAEDEAVKEEELAKKAKSRKTEGEIGSARERYLQRKREAEEAKKKKQKEDRDKDEGE
ncbi:MAG: hypothetical protein M1825_005091 [Sarcosagium campestre]|nr:MAG: hypothetical protein M1825_005091 [Sarcosagium campestre]